MSTENKAATAAKPETKITTVTMTDGRVVEFPGKRKLLKESFFEEETGAISVRLDFVNGETRTFTIPESLLARFAAHGAEQKLGDEIAREDDIDDAVQAIDELMDRLDKGEWNAKREAGTGAGGSILFKALVEVTKQPKEKITAFLAGIDAKTKMALRKDPALQPVIARLEAEKAARSAEKAPAVNTQFLLAGLTGASAE